MRQYGQAPTAPRLGSARCTERSGLGSTAHHQAGQGCGPLVGEPRGRGGSKCSTWAVGDRSACATFGAQSPRSLRFHLRSGTKPCRCAQMDSARSGARYRPLSPGPAPFVRSPHRQRVAKVTARQCGRTASSWRQLRRSGGSGAIGAPKPGDCSCRRAAGSSTAVNGELPSATHWAWAD